jgi:hypothetical protein
MATGLFGKGRAYRPPHFASVHQAKARGKKFWEFWSKWEFLDYRIEVRRDEPVWNWEWKSPTKKV